MARRTRPRDSVTERGGQLGGRLGDLDEVERGGAGILGEIGENLRRLA
jgi:hypothetical protein